jgi:hypothetical protein
MSDKIFQDQSEMSVIFVHSSLDDANLSVFAFRIYCHIARRANGKGSAFPGADSMSAVCGMGRTKVKEAVKELEERNMLQVIRSSGGTKSNVYLLTPPSKWTPGRVATGSSDDQHPVAERPAPGRVATPKVIHEGNPDKDTPLAPKGELIEDVGSESRPIKIKTNLRKEYIQQRVHSWFNRRPSTKWSKKEIKSLEVLVMAYSDETDEDLYADVDLLEWYYTKTKCEFLRREPLTLLNNWQGEISKAKQYTEE